MIARQLIAMIFICLCTTAQAEEINWEAIGSEANALHAAAREKGDLWTAIQLESFVADYPGTDTRLTSYLGRSQIIGSPLFAFPEEIHFLWNRGETVALISGRSFYRIDKFGRPLQLSIDLPFFARRSDLNHQGNLLGVAETLGKIDNRQMYAAVLNAKTGTILWRSKIPLTGIKEGQNDYLHHDLKISEDGSAMLSALYRSEVGFPRIMLTTKDSNRIIPNMHRPQGVGPKGSWLIASRGEQQLLITGESEMKIDAAAIGPGIAVVRKGESFSLVSTDGIISPYSPPINLGNKPQVWSLGNWLIVGSGDGAKGEAITDLLGNIVEESPIQPYTLEFLLWSDLSENTKAQEVIREENRYSRCDFKANTLYTWQGNQIFLLDLNGENPALSPWLTCDEPVEWVGNSHHYTMVNHPNNKRSVYNNLGEQLWQGDNVSDAWVHSRRGLLVRRNAEKGPSYSFVILHKDPAKRSEVQLQLPPSRWNIRTHYNQNLIIADSDEVWHQLDMETGKITKSVIKDLLVEYPNPPRWESESNHYGSFWANDGRLQSKAQYGDDLPFALRLVPQDALYTARALIIIDHSGAVLMFDPRKGFEEIGRADAAVFVTDDKQQQLYLARRRHLQVVAKLERGPSLSTNLEGAPERGKELSSGGWKFDWRNHFMPPRGSQLQWDNERAGFEPRRLRSGGRQLMIVVTQSLLLVIEPRAIPLISSPVH